ncbi:hypothetical protein Btru_009580 [Bulinus truncatus]|nr:hypothetical protein Btru_009580 [Bulinus truncatus]
MLPSNRGDDTIICPYESSHVIQKKSFQNHLIKCRENNKNSSKSVCKFDKTHIVPTPELLHHLSECPSRSVFDRELQLKASSGQAFTGAIQAPEIINHIEDLNEDWGSAPPARTKALFNKKYDDSFQDDLTLMLIPEYHALRKWLGLLSPALPTLVWLISESTSGYTITIMQVNDLMSHYVVEVVKEFYDQLDDVVRKTPKEMHSCSY